jgi:hypothetical protein
MEDAHYCPTCWLDTMRKPGYEDIVNLQLLHGWTLVHPDRKKEILLICQPSIPKVERVEMTMLEVEYDGYGDEFFIQENN